jgi:hypothetical protein
LATPPGESTKILSQSRCARIFITQAHSTRWRYVHATQTTNGSQPVYDSILGLLNFSTQSNSFLNMGTSSSGPIPTGTLNAPYTLFAKHGRVFSISNSFKLFQTFKNTS